MKFILYVFIIVSSFSCSKENLSDDKLTLSRVPISTKELKLKGYYYTKYDNSQKVSIYFLYNDGTLLFAGDGFDYNNINDYEKTLLSENFINKLKNIKFAWGIFNISDKFIQLEKWEPSSGGPLKSYIKSGTIINDTIFVLNQSKRSNGDELNKIDKTYYFKKLTSKPDSTNSFIN